MPRGQQATTVVDRPLRTTRKNSEADQPIVQKPPRVKRVADENAGNEAKSRKRAAFGDLTNVSFLKKCISENIKYLFLFSLEPVCCKKQKKVPDQYQLLVCRIGDL